MADANIAVASWLQRLAPDVAATVRRFPFAIILAACTTVVFLLSLNADWRLDEEGWLRLFIGFATGAVCAVAGVFFAESRPQARRTAIVLAYVLPVAVVALCQVRDAGWVVPFALPAASILWLSVSPFTRPGQGAEGEDLQRRFWWINQRAVATAALAALAFAVIAIGVAAIERSLSLLFGIESGDLFYRWVLPVVGLFLVPVYWLATLPRVDDYDATDMERPDFIASALGFLGEFVLAPFLGIYALILLAYTVQIAITQQLPTGTIGWMVMGFVVAGAATWLVLYPPFLDRKPLVRLFRRAWFWLTLIPLALFFLAVWIRVDAYGLTTERLLLVLGGLWAAILSVVFLLGRGDIRLIPALAGGILLVFSFGPWSYLAWPDHDQGARLSRLLADVKDPTASVSTPDWDADEQARARSAIDYLLHSNHGKQTLERILLDYGFVWEGSWTDPGTLMRDLGYPDNAVSRAESISGIRDETTGVDVSKTPLMLGKIRVSHDYDGDRFGYRFRVEGGEMVVRPTGVQPADPTVLARLSLGPWLEKQRRGSAGEPWGVVVEPWLDLNIEGRAFRIVVESFVIDIRHESDGPRRTLQTLEGVVFAAPAIPRP